jgi:2-C-methyl-D-erythritol 4-phosphate cytidylyltransferase/2-C-methyl-D-erythritol 2,4-cyclodiphosphate synthase
VERAALIVLAAGMGERLGLQTPKAFLPVAGTPMLERAVASALGSAAITEVVVVAPPGWEDRAREIVEPLGPCTVVAGGATRQASVRAGLAAVSREARVIVCHDAARPLARPKLFSAVLGALEGWDGVVPVVPVTDTVKRLKGERIEGTEVRGGLALAQTPQAFLAGVLRDAHARAERDGVEVTDDAAALELAGYRVRAIDGEPGNFKVTMREDLARAVAAVAGRTQG